MIKEIFKAMKSIYEEAHSAHNDLHIGNIVFDEEGKISIINWTFFTKIYNQNGLSKGKLGYVY